jgi:hypothetical protein
MSPCPSNAEPDPCVLQGVEPILSELQAPIRVEVIDAGHAERTATEQFIHRIFQRSYRADVQSYYPTLLSFDDGGQRRAAVGFRDARAQAFFAEQYLSEPAERVIGRRLGVTIARASVVEVGNLALARPGDARWVIAATTLFLHALGYRWVLFTAIRPLINAFQRLGLQPVRLASAHASQLADKGQHWGGYYESGPVVCAGDIESGYQKLHRHLGHHQPMLRALLGEMTRQADMLGRLSGSCCGGL